MIVLLFVLLVFCVATMVLEGVPALFLSNRLDRLKANIICNFVTNPILNIVMLLVVGYVQSNTILLAALVSLEIMVVIFEAYIYAQIMYEPYWKCFIYSLIVNAISLAAGLYFSSLFEQPKPTFPRPGMYPV